MGGSSCAMWMSTQWRIEFDFEKSEDFYYIAVKLTLSAELNVVVGAWPGQPRLYLIGMPSIHIRDQSNLGKASF